MIVMTLKWLMFESLLVSAGTWLTRFVMNSEPQSFPQAVPDLVFPCAYHCLPIFGPSSPDSNFLILPGRLCSNMFKDTFKFQADKYVADRFQPSLSHLSHLSRRATLPLCRQRWGLFGRDHWKDRKMCRSWSMFECRQQHVLSKDVGSEMKPGLWITSASLHASAQWYTVHLKHKGSLRERPQNFIQLFVLARR